MARRPEISFCPYFDSFTGECNAHQRASEILETTSKKPEINNYNPILQAYETLQAIAKHLAPHAIRMDLRRGTEIICSLNRFGGNKQRIATEQRITPKCQAVREALSKIQAIRS